MNTNQRLATVLTARLGAEAEPIIAALPSSEPILPDLAVFLGWEGAAEVLAEAGYISTNGTPSRQSPIKIMADAAIRAIAQSLCLPPEEVRRELREYLDRQ
jgi:hypothetical protein